MNKEEFYEKLKILNINLSDKQKQQFEEYFNILYEYNAHTNITTIKQKDDVYLKHFYDSALLIKATDFNNIETMLDIGSGAGFPGIVIKILFPHIKITLLDSNNKKTKFLDLIINNLNLDNAYVVNKRAEEYINERREYFDVVTARAVKDLSILNELAIPYIKIDGIFIAMKAEYEEELSHSKKGIIELGGSLEKIINIKDENNLGKRNLIIIKKEKRTDKKYPRNYNSILKHPL